MKPILSMTLSLFVASLLGGCDSLGRLAGTSITDPGPVYSTQRNQDGVLDIQVFREETELILTNTSASAFEGGGRLWVNAQYSRPFDDFPIGRTKRLDLRDFVNEYGERFRAGGFFATQRPDEVVLVQIEHGDRVDGLVVVKNEVQ